MPSVENDDQVRINGESHSIADQIAPSTTGGSASEIKLDVRCTSTLFAFSHLRILDFSWVLRIVLSCYEV
jgi:hypothetical protein